MKIAVIGAGYVGLVSGACFAELGNKVALLDVSEEKVAAINAGKCPIYEPGLEELLQKHMGRGLSASTKAKKALADAQLIFICVGTPRKNNGSTDMKYVFGAAKAIGKALRKRNDQPIVVLKSTTPPTKIGEIAAAIEKASGKKNGAGFFFCTNPEFLREGSAVGDFLKPDRVVAGCTDEESRKALSALYSPLNSKLFFSSTKSAMMVKYASNAFLAAKISFANEMGNICKKLGIDSHEVADGMALDKRINRAFLNSGCGFGGSCFPKDVASITHEAKKLGVKPVLLSSVLAVNKQQPQKMVGLLEARLGNLKDKKIGILGLAFKPDTDDVRESPSLAVMASLLEKGAIIFAYDPKGMENAKKAFANATYCASAQEAIDKSDAVLVMTDWKEFENISTPKPLIEGKRILKEKRENYEGICW